MNVPELAGRLAALAATLSQAEAVLDMVQTHGDLPRIEGSAICGAVTILQSAWQDLDAMEREARIAEAGGGA